MWWKWIVGRFHETVRNTGDMEKGKKSFIVVIFGHDNMKLYRIYI